MEDLLPSAAAYIPQPSQNLFQIDDQTVLVVLPHGSQLPLTGTYQLQVLAGIVAFAGGSLTPSPTWYRVFAPTCFHVPSIKHISPLPNSAVPAFVPKNLQTRIQEAQSTSSIILIRSLRTNINRVMTVCHPFRDVFPAQERRELGIEGISVGLCFCFTLRNLKPADRYRQWESICRSLFLLRGNPLYCRSTRSSRIHHP